MTATDTTYQPLQPGQTVAQYLSDLAKITAVTLLGESAVVQLTTEEDKLTVAVKWQHEDGTQLGHYNSLYMNACISILALKDFMISVLMAAVELNANFDNGEGATK